MYLADEAVTHQVGIDIGHRLVPGDRVFLEGHLGAGKTSLVRGILYGLGYEGIVKSPSYTIMESYSMPHGLEVFHGDLYRIRSISELRDMGFSDYFRSDVIILLEWPERGESYLPLPTLRYRLEMNYPGRSLLILP